MQECFVKNNLEHKNNRSVWLSTGALRYLAIEREKKVQLKRRDWLPINQTESVGAVLRKRANVCSVIEMSREKCIQKQLNSVCYGEKVLNPLLLTKNPITFACTSKLDRFLLTRRI